MTFLPLDTNIVTEEMLQKAEEELGETESKRMEALAQFKREIKEDGKLLCMTDDAFLLAFLRVRKFDVQRAMDNLKNFYRVLFQYSDIFKMPKFEMIEKLFQSKAISVLPYRDKDGCALVVLSLKNLDYEGIGMSVFLTAVEITEVLTAYLHAPTQICGLKFIVDATGIGIKHLRYIFPRHLIFFGKGMTNVLPIRYQDQFVMNASVAIYWMWNIMKPVLSSKLRKRVRFLRMEELIKFVDPAIVPTEYGGTLDHNNDFWMNICKGNETKYHEIFNGRYDS